ncbi:Bro-N domain-containing protein [Cereibacter sphaeroides f. sp. denitrificans]|nr:hypothetical protein DWF04_16100 [Cereibacter sphaeroides f. sp. denitrificans]
MGQHINPLLFEEEHLVRQIDRDGEAWFVGIDVCRALGLANPHSSLALLDEDERGVHTVETLGGQQEVAIISEAGIYRLVFKSRKPVAERFKRWLAHEVIPSIRRTGAYFGNGAADPVTTKPDVERRAFPDWSLEEVRTKRGIVDMHRMLYGTMAAQWIAPQLGFPVPPVELVENGRQMKMILVPQVEQ